MSWFQFQVFETVPNVLKLTMIRIAGDPAAVIDIFVRGAVTLVLPADAVLVIAGVGAGGGHARAQSTGLATVLCHKFFVAASFSHILAVGVLVYTWNGCCHWGICGFSHSLTMDHRQLSPNAAHPDTTLHPDEPIFSPVGAPAVLYQPERYTSFCAVANNCDDVVQP